MNDDARTKKRPNVVPFVDAATLAIRRQAVRRVKEAGIFKLPAGLDEE